MSNAVIVDTDIGGGPDDTTPVAGPWLAWRGHRGRRNHHGRSGRGAVVSGDPPPLPTPDASGLHKVARIVGVPPQDVADLVVLLEAAEANIRDRLGYLANHTGAAAAAALAAARYAADDHVIANVYGLLAQLWAVAGGRRDLAADALEQMAAIQRRAGSGDTAEQLEQAAARQRADIPE